MTSSGRKTEGETAQSQGVAKRIEELKALLMEPTSQHREKKEEKTNGGNDGASSLLGTKLAEVLFAKAPQEFLERRTAAELNTIVLDSYNFIESFISSGEKILIGASSDGPHTCVTIALGNRPFIVDSVLECLRRYDLNIEVFLHPILSIDRGAIISFMYVRTDALSLEKLDMLKIELGSVLNDVILATDDYTPILVRVETLIRVLDSEKNLSLFPHYSIREASDFLKWLTDDHYVFLGHIKWEVEEDGDVKNEPKSMRGILLGSIAKQHADIREIYSDAVSLLESNDLIGFTKLRLESTVFSRSRMDHIAVQELSPDGKLKAIHSFIGLLSLRALTEISSKIPLIRRKLQKILEIENVVSNSYDYENIVRIIDSTPKRELLRLDSEELREDIRKILSIRNKSDTRVVIRYDRTGRGVSVMIAVSRERFNNFVQKKLQEHVEAVFGAVPNSTEYVLTLRLNSIARMYFYVPFRTGDLPPIDLGRLEQDLIDLTKTWRDNVREKINSASDITNSEQIARKFVDQFPESYHARRSPDECVDDVKVLEGLTSDNAVRVVRRRYVDDGSMKCNISVYSFNREISLSVALPVLENAGFYVLSETETRFDVQGAGRYYIHEFVVSSKTGQLINAEVFERCLAPGLEAVFQERAENDVLNTLLLHAQLDVRAISLLRAYCSYLWQVNKFSGSRRKIMETLAAVPTAASQIWSMFEIRFNPEFNSSLESRNDRFSAALRSFRDTLRLVTDITSDRILRAIVNILENTLRTNFYLNQPTIAIKVSPPKIDLMPKPRPLFEIFVTSPTVEGVHLRSARVARGGIRWSDRPEDFRSEVLSLMKTQKVKNVVIVPSGSKGGFVLKRRTAGDDIGKVVQDGYRAFIRGLLSITDNRVGDKVEHPKNVVIYDDTDPYLVVAADKGTAKFSDIANKIAVEEYNFWLGDAFASGGSKGYDHKIYGITARGAWECFKRHCKDLGIHYETQPFTAIGIGDMAGDVFGNGLLLSQNYKLVAAFNHKHIFVDPSPDQARSFQERKRLYELTGSQWSDYSPSLISKGGGVFERSAKEIVITPEMRDALSITDPAETLNGDQLISCILRSKVDMLWNGGIGTYVKSRDEANADVEDGTNDAVRVNADELRVRIVCEGGNLGFTQKGRIEYARCGGRLNTDAIDNSGGVSLSDHEVNLKILLSDLIKNKKLSSQQRDEFLRKAADEVCEMVLGNNRSHALLLTLSSVRSIKRIDYFKSLIRDLSKNDYLDRVIEFLPDDEEFDVRARNKEGLTRPELAVCVAYTKIWLKDILLNSDLLADPELETFLLSYFPKDLRKDCLAEIRRHPLAREIIATEVVNFLVDKAGPTLVHRMCLNHSCSAITVIKCFLAAVLLLDSKNVRTAIVKLDTFDTYSVFIGAWQDMNRSIQNATSWLVRYHGDSATLTEMVEFYKGSFDSIVNGAEEILSGEARDKYLLRLDLNHQYNLNERAARQLACYPEISTILAMIWASRRAGKDPRIAASVYYHLLATFRINSILRYEDSIEVRDKWENELLATSINSLRESLSNLTTNLLNKEITSREGIEQFVGSLPAAERVRSHIDEFVDSAPSVSALSVIAKDLIICAKA